MNVRRLILVFGAIVLVAGVIALLVPVSVSDGQGKNVDCGNAVAEDQSAAQSANSGGVANIPVLNQIVPHTDFVAQCHAAVSSRRSWSIPLAVLGLVGVVGGAVVRPRSVGITG